MRTPLEQSLLQAIQHAGMLGPGDRVGVAVSGGADSVALLRLLERLRDDLGITLAVVHFNHSLRATDRSRGDLSRRGRSRAATAGHSTRGATGISAGHRAVMARGFNQSR